ncbi:hypothetical protein D3C80_127000 [compost metagenome]
MTKKTIEIFRAGTHVGQDGRRYTFSEAEVQAIAAAYDKGKFSAPVVIGHPIKSDAPAYAWADAVRVRDDGVMEADLEQVNPAFADLVDKGAYKKVSTAFYPAEHPNNPTPGQLHIRHIGFLGAAAPGVQGLAPVEFAEGDDDGLISFALGEEFRPLVWMARSLGRIMRRHRDQIIAEEGVEAADRQIPEYEIESATDAATRLNMAIDSDGNGPRFNEGEPSAEEAARAAELDQREADIAAREQAAAARDAEAAQAQADAARTARQSEDAAFVEGLAAAGRLPDGHASLILGFCDALGSAEMIAFAEGEDVQDPRQAFKAYLTQNLGVAIRFDELAGGEGLQFAEGPSLDDLTAAIDVEMNSAAAAGTPISAAEASRRAKARR